MPTFIAAIIVGAVRALVAVAAILVTVAACGGGREAWPDCLRVLGATHVRVASSADLRKSPQIFAATRAATVEFRDGVEATIVVSRTMTTAAATALALGSVPSVIDMPGPDMPLRPSAVRRRGTIIMQWFGRRNAGRERVLLDCAAS